MSDGGGSHIEENLKIMAKFYIYGSNISIRINTFCIQNTVLMNFSVLIFLTWLDLGLNLLYFAAWKVSERLILIPSDTCQAANDKMSESGLDSCTSELTPSANLQRLLYPCNLPFSNLNSFWTTVNHTDIDKMDEPGFDSCTSWFVQITNFWYKFRS